MSLSERISDGFPKREIHSLTIMWKTFSPVTCLLHGTKIEKTGHSVKNGQDVVQVVDEIELDEVDVDD